MAGEVVKEGARKTGEAIKKGAEKVKKSEFVSKFRSDSKGCDDTTVEVNCDEPFIPEVCESTAPQVTRVFLVS